MGEGLWTGRAGLVPQTSQQRALQYTRTAQPPSLFREAGQVVAIRSRSEHGIVRIVDWSIAALNMS
eukprot:7424922-Alexandrium_andersonii.AAC.1